MQLLILVRCLLCPPPPLSFPPPSPTARYHINSVGVNSDGATFLSADDLRVNLWSLENAKLAFNIVDIKPPTLEELTEVITVAVGTLRGH